jgi:hypothetical protein
MKTFFSIDVIETDQLTPTSYLAGSCVVLVDNYFHICFKAKQFSVFALSFLNKAEQAPS